MRAILYVKSGPHAGQQIELQHGRSILVGSAPPARLVLDQDQQLAKVHFMVEFVSHTCRVSDMRTEAGTFLGKERLTAKTEAEDGSVIAAGGSEFLLRFGEGDLSPDIEAAEPSEPEPAPVPLRTDVAVELPKPKPAPLSQHEMLVQREECQSGLWCYEPAESGIAPWDLLKRLSETFTVCALVDVIKLGLAKPADVETPTYLFSWLSKEVQPLTSPIILARGTTREFDPILKTDWGHDGIVIICSELKQDELVEKLRELARYSGRNKKPSEQDSALGCYIPSVFSAMLTYTRPTEVQEWFESLSAVILESGAEDEWQIFAPLEFAEPLVGIGFALQEDPEPEGDGKA